MKAKGFGILIRLIATVFVLIYFATVIITYYLGVDEILFILSQPWSSVIALFSFLLIHIADDGMKLMHHAMILGSVINSVIALTIIWKFKKKVSEN